MPSPVITVGRALGEDAAGSARSPHATPPGPGPLHAGQAEQAIKAPVTHRDNRKIPERKISA